MNSLNGTEKWLYIALIFLVIGVISAVFVNALKFGSYYGTTLYAILMALTVIGILGAAFCFLWWAILRRAELVGKY